MRQQIVGALSYKKGQWLGAINNKLKKKQGFSGVDHLHCTHVSFAQYRTVSTELYQIVQMFSPLKQ